MHALVTERLGMDETFQPLPRRTWRWIIAVSFLAAVVALIVGLTVSSNNHDSNAKPKIPVTSSQPSASAQPPSPTISVPNDAKVLLSESQARAVSGVPTLEWRSSSGVESHGSRLSSDTRYGTSGNFFPDRSLRYVEVAIYKGTTEYTNMRDQSFDASTADHDWSFLSPSTYSQLAGASEAFMSVRYAKDGSVIRTLGFSFDNVTLKIEICNLPANDLLDAAKVVITHLHQLDNVNSV
jgi:hypothetical protein